MAHSELLPDGLGRDVVEHDPLVPRTHHLLLYRQETISKSSKEKIENLLPLPPQNIFLQDQIVRLLLETLTDRHLVDSSKTPSLLD